MDMMHLRIAHYLPQTWKWLECLQMKLHCCILKPLMVSPTNVRMKDQNLLKTELLTPKNRFAENLDMPAELFV